MISLTEAEREFFEAELSLHETKYLAGANVRQQSGFGRDEHDWRRYRRPIADTIEKSGSFLDIGCANGLLMESVVAWAAEDGHVIEPYGLDISAKLADLARERLARWRDRIFVGNALLWTPPRRFDFVRTEMVYVPASRRREYVARLLDTFVQPEGRLLVCSYGSSRPEGVRTEPLVPELEAWDFAIEGVFDALSDHGFVTTRVVALAATA